MSDENYYMALFMLILFAAVFVYVTTERDVSYHVDRQMEMIAANPGCDKINWDGSCAY